MNPPRVDSTRNPLLGGQCIAVKLRSFVDKSFPSFFQGGVAGIADLEMVTIMLSRPGWLKRIQQKWTYFSELNQPPRPDHLYFCTSDDLVVWPPLLEKEGKLIRL